MIPTLSDIDEYVMENSAAAALQEMRDDGFYVSSIHVLHARIKHLNNAGIRRHIPHNERLLGIDSYGVDVNRHNAVAGCNALLKAQIAAGQVMGEAMERWQTRYGAC